MRLIARTLNQIKSPIDEANALSKEYKGVRPLIDLTQGVTNYATAPVVAAHIANIALDPEGGKYTSRPGLDKVRRVIAEEISQAYGGKITSDQVLITAGCNQAYCLAISALADYNEEVILPVPYYFNHEMWLRLDRISPVYLNTAPQFIPDPAAAEALITEKTKAIVLVTPGNPTGVTIPSSTMLSFYEIAKKHDIMLIIDETYRVFRTEDTPAHQLFEQQSWDQNVVSLHSFSKEFAIPGHRVGAIIAHPDLISEMMKLFDCIAICAPRLGQEAVFAALKFAKEWRQERVLEIRKKQLHFESIFESKPGGFELCTSGAFYGWVKHPVNNEPTHTVVRRMLLDNGILVLPGTIFTPSDDHFLRFSFANLTPYEIDDLGVRLRDFF